MLYRIHGHTTDLRPAVPLRLVLVVSPSSLQHRLVDPTTAGNNTDHGSVGAGDNLLSARRQLNPGSLGIWVVGDHRGVVAGSSGHLPPVASLLLQVADDGSLWHVAHWHHVTDGQLSLPSTIDKLGDGKGSPTAGVVDDVLDNSLDVTMALGIVCGA